MFAVDAYEVAQRERGLAGVTVERARRHLDVLLRLDVNGGRRLAWLTAKRGAQLYELVQIGRAVDTHRNALAAGRAFGKWCTKRGWLLANPFADVEAVGKRRRGKPQLHVDEARKLRDVCYAENTRESLAVATALLLGYSASETTQRQVRDLDDGGRVLVMTKGKNDHRKRRTELPEELSVRLRELARGRPAAAFLFGEGDLDRPSRYWIHYHCRRLCIAAKVPVVPPHGLRGTHSTIATETVATSHSVQAALDAAGASLGHAPRSPITASTYVAPGTVERARQRSAMRVLDGGTGAGNPRSNSGYQRRAGRS